MCAEFEQHLPAVRGWTELLGEWPDSNADAETHVLPTRACWTMDNRGWAQRQWSLVPPWTDSPKMKFATFNARAETLAEKPAFRSAWKHGQRCLIPASRYFEWGVTPAGKRKHGIWATHGDALMMAGLHEQWTSDEQSLDTCTVVTVAANDALRDLHGRMPLLLDPSAAQIWLQGGASVCEQLLQSPPDIPLSYEAIEFEPKIGETASLF